MFASTIRETSPFESVVLRRRIELEPCAQWPAHPEKDLKRARTVKEKCLRSCGFRAMWHWQVSVCGCVRPRRRLSTTGSSACSSCCGGKVGQTTTSWVAASTRRNGFPCGIAGRDGCDAAIAVHRQSSRHAHYVVGKEFVIDALSDGPRLRLLTVVHHFTHEYPNILVKQSLHCEHVTDALAGLERSATGSPRTKRTVALRV